MIIREYRIPLPLSVAEYQIGQLYSVAEASKNETSGGEGVQVLVNEPFQVSSDDDRCSSQDENGQGQYTHKIYHLKDKVPAIIRVLAPSGALEIHEKAWNAFPNCKTVMTNAYMKESFKMVIESRHVDDDISKVENVSNINHDSSGLVKAHNLDRKELAKREIVNIDISSEPIEAKDYKPEEDPRLFHSETTDRGPLVDPNWALKSKPVMTCYKLVTVEFKWLGLQGNVESLIQKIVKGVFVKFHRQMFCWIDKWHGMSMDDIRQLEERTKSELDEKRSAHPPPSNNPQNDDKHSRATTQ